MSKIFFHRKWNFVGKYSLKAFAFNVFLYLANVFLISCKRRGKFVIEKKIHFKIQLFLKFDEEKKLRKLKSLYENVKERQNKNIKVSRNKKKS